MNIFSPFPDDAFSCGLQTAEHGDCPFGYLADLFQSFELALHHSESKSRNAESDSSGLNARFYHAVFEFLRCHGRGAFGARDRCSTFTMCALLQMPPLAFLLALAVTMESRRRSATRWNSPYRCGASSKAHTAISATTTRRMFSHSRIFIVVSDDG